MLNVSLASVIDKNLVPEFAKSDDLVWFTGKLIIPGDYEANLSDKLERKSLRFSCENLIRIKIQGKAA